MSRERSYGGYDYPESGFDALLQAIVCTEVSGSADIPVILDVV